MEPGVDFIKSLSEQVANCDVLIAVIGPSWLTANTSAGNRRLDDPNDYVRIELEAALKRDIRVIPVLVDGAPMPPMSELPASIECLARRHGVEIAHHRFAADCDGLAHSIKRALGLVSEPSATTPSKPSSASQVQTDRKLTWPEILLSFNGRIPRMQYLIAGTTGMVFALTIIFLMMIIRWIVEGSDAYREEASQRLMEVLSSRMTQVVIVVAWWPTWALALKRLHDFEHGWITLLVIVALDVATFVLDLMNEKDLSLQVGLVLIGLGFMLAIVNATTGPNMYRTRSAPPITPCHRQVLPCKAPGHSPR